MTRNQFIEAVQAHFADKTPAFEERINAAIPIGIARFCQEWQWEFLDKYATLSTATSTTDASGKTVFSLPGDYFKTVAIWTDDRDINYVTRTEWAALQRQGTATQPLECYTVIGKQLVLAAPTNDSLYWIYTRDSSGFELEDIPAQYHYAIQMAVVEYLAPAYVTVNDKVFPNPDVRHAHLAFMGAVNEARTIELRSKARGKRILPPEHIRMVNDY